MEFVRCTQQKQKGDLNMKKMIRQAAGLFAAVSTTALLSLTAFAEGEAAASASGTAQQPYSTGQWLVSLLPFVIVLLLMWLFLFRPQQKRDKEAKLMRENVRVGDEICTAGGLVGIVIKVSDDTVVLETGGERSKIRVKKWAIHENITQLEEAQAAEKARKAAKQSTIAAAGVSTDEKPKKSKKDED